MGILDMSTGKFIHEVKTVFRIAGTDSLVNKYEQELRTNILEASRHGFKRLVISCDRYKYIDELMRAVENICKEPEFEYVHYHLPYRQVVISWEFPA